MYKVLKLWRATLRLLTVLMLTIIAYGSLAYPVTDTVATANGATNVLISYQTDAADGWTITWNAIPSGETLGEVNLPFPPAAFAAPPSGHHFAVVDATANAFDVYMVDMRDAASHELPVPILHKEVFLRDAEYLQAYSLRWSPDVRTLAYIGQTSPGRADIYLYDTATTELTNLSAHIPFADDFVNLSDWSPDGNWLAFTGRWGQAAAQEDAYGGGMLSHDGDAVIGLPSVPDLCDLVWSPERRYLFSHNDCLGFNNAQNGRDLIIYPVSLDQVDAPQLLPFRSSEITANPLWRFHHPMWHMDGSIITLRTFDQPLLNGTPLGTPGPDAELIHIDIETRRLQVLDHPTAVIAAIMRNGFATDDWLFHLDDGMLYAHQPVNNTSFNVPLTTDQPCSARYARLSVDEQYLALCVGIYPDEPLPTLLIWDVVAEREVLRVPATGDNPPVPLGWMKVEDRP